MPASHPPDYVFVVANVSLLDVAVVAPADVSTVDGPALVPAVVDPLELADDPPVVAVSVGEKQAATARAPRAASKTGRPNRGLVAVAR